jgi:glycosyltransferase involved in cell wall biosynthesis
MVAYLVPQKRHIDFILAAKKAHKELPSTKFFIIGSAYSTKKGLEYAKYLYRLVKDENMGKYITFTGYCKNIVKVIAAMDLIVLPSFEEGFGNAILEAMAKAKPVIGANSGAIPEIIRDGVTGRLVPPKSPQKLSEAILEILKDPIKAKKMGEAGRERAKRLFDIKKTVRKYEELYERVYACSF